MPRIVRFHSFGGPEVLQIDDLPEDKPGPGEVRIKVQAFALNRADYLYRRNMHAVTPRLPSRIGYEATGIVEAVGPQVTEFKIGDRVSNQHLGVCAAFERKRPAYYLANAGPLRLGTARASLVPGYDCLLHRVC